MIDAHQHFWRIGQNDCAWPTPDLAAIHRDFLPDDLAPLMRDAGVAGAVLVQTQPSDHDTDWLLSLAAKDDRIKAVVGWADLKAPDAAARVAGLTKHPKVRGLRPMLQGLAEDDWILDSAAAPALEAMIAHRLSFDALVFTKHLKHIRTLAARYPDLRIVIDHAAKPPIAQRALEPWRNEIRALGGLENVWCKLSGLLTEAAPGDAADQLRPYVDHLIATFGPSRLMWGSDWPVLNLAATYPRWLAMAQDLCGDLSAGDQARVFGGVAREFYRL